MGKSVTVKPGYSFVEAPGKFGVKTYPAGATIILTDAEYTALPQSVARALSAASDVDEPARPDATVYGSPQQLSDAVRKGTIPIVLRAPGTPAVPAHPAGTDPVADPAVPAVPAVPGKFYRLAVANDGALSTVVYVP